MTESDERLIAEITRRWIDLLDRGDRAGASEAIRRLRASVVPSPDVVRRFFAEHEAAERERRD